MKLGVGLRVGVCVLVASGLLGACGHSDGGASGGAGALDPLFTDPKVPTCPNPGDYKLQGTLAGQSVSYSSSVVTNLDPQGFQILDVVNANVVTDLGLTWSDPLAENKAIPLTGASIIMPAGQPEAGQSLCISGGTFGSKSLPAGVMTRELRFEITAAKEGSCTGAPTTIDLAGCVARSTPYFPVPIPADGGLQFTSSVPDPTLDPNRKLTDLTRAEAGLLCDWEAASLGGYGTSTDCKGEGVGVTVSGNPNQAVCIKSEFDQTCPQFTVAEYEACVKAMVPKRGCVYPDACRTISGRCAARDF